MTQKQILELLAKRVRYQVFRGGSWINVTRNCRSAGRNNFDPTFRNRNLGFRLVLIRRKHDTKTNA